MELKSSDVLRLLSLLAAIVPTVAAATCIDTLVLASHVELDAFVVQVQYTASLDELVSVSDAYREAQLETLALAGQCFGQYSKLKKSEKRNYSCNSDLMAGSVWIKNYSLRSEILCQDRHSLRIASVVSFLLK